MNNDPRPTSAVREKPAGQPRDNQALMRTVSQVLLRLKPTKAGDFFEANVNHFLRHMNIDDHHLFPAAYLRDTKGIKSTVARDCVLNRTLIDRTTNQIISARAPSDYMATIQKTQGFPFDAVLLSHCLPVGATSPLLADDYDAFLDWRQQRLWQEIQRVTGLHVAADLEITPETL